MNEQTFGSGFNVNMRHRIEGDDFSVYIDAQAESKGALLAMQKGQLYIYTATLTTASGGWLDTIRADWGCQ